MEVIDRQRRAAPQTLPGFAATTWAALRSPPDATPDRFDPATLDELPLPARRLLARAVPPGSLLTTLLEIDMEGDIKLAGRWFPFTARQVLRAGTGFVWAPQVGGRVLRFTGADALGPDGARIEFRLHGRIPVVRGSGEDVRRSAQGRLAAETVAWMPQALTPQASARWASIDDHRAVVTLDAAGTDIDVDVTVDEHGRLVRLGLQRWNDSASPPALAPFGGSVDATMSTPTGVGIAGSGTVGWDWDTTREADGTFFRYRITDARYPSIREEHP